MSAEAWAATIGAIVAATGVLITLVTLWWNRRDRREDKTDAELDEVREDAQTHTKQALAGISAQVTALAERFGRHADRTERRFDGLDERVDKLAEQVARHEGRFDVYPPLNGRPRGRP